MSTEFYIKIKYQGMKLQKKNQVNKEFKTKYIAIKE
jgi:hypothetical protein